MLVSMDFSANEIRVLGALIEKEINTPEYYPLSLNALVAACNQKSSREPVMELSEDEVRAALHHLEDMDYTATAHDSRVPKFEHRVRTVLNLRRDETALLCLLLLRGPQTPGELRTRADRMYAFDDVPAVQSALNRLIERETPLVVLLPRQPGAREARYAHLLSGMPDVTEMSAAAKNTTAGSNRMEELEAKIAVLEERMAALEQRLTAVGA
ncbi:YceH family protein [Terriglobus tenax]|uniref:YceH family protein n=1 Tax=Terriglobus tenax TaxID=1111115 RepID=UPI0021E0F2D1|nr:YceH family protein [Terriglobus tenax]